MESQEAVTKGVLLRSAAAFLLPALAIVCGLCIFLSF